MRHESGDFQGSAGLRLHEQSWLPDGAPKAAVILHHGLWDYSDYYAPFAEELTHHGYAVYAFDMRGHGRSDGDRSFVKSIDQYIADLEIFLKRVRQRVIDKRLFLFGHSLGGLIAATYGLANPQNELRGMILSGAGLKTGNDVTPLLKTLVPIIASIAPKLPTYKPDFDYGSRDQSVTARKRRDPLIDHKGAPARSGAAGLAAIANIQSRMEQFSMPVLILHGTEDRWTNPEGSRQLATRASSTDKTLKLYDGFYHELLTDTDKSLVWKDVIGWMDERV